MESTLIDKAFSKGFIQGAGRNKVSSEYASYIRNGRIENGSMTIRKGNVTRISDVTGTRCRGITANEQQGNLLIARNSKLAKANSTISAYTDIGSIGNDSDCTFLNYGKYCMILNGGNPYVYNGDVLFQLSASSYTPGYLTSGTGVTTVIATRAAVNNGSFKCTIDGTARDITGCDFTGVTTFDQIAAIIQVRVRVATSGTETVLYKGGKFVIYSGSTASSSQVSVTSAVGSGTDISGAGATNFLDMDTGNGVATAAAKAFTPLVNPIIGTVFSGFTVIVGNTTEDKNVLYFSQPIIPTDQTRCYKWLTDGAVTAEKINARSEVLGVLGTLNNMFVWTKQSVEYMDKNSISSINGTASLYLNVMGEGDQLLSSKIPVSANDMAFYITKDFVVKSLGYIQGTTNTTIGELSDRPLLNIRDFLTQELNSDQSQSFGFREGNLIQRHLRSSQSLINDIVLIYDVTNDSRLCDNNKYFQSMTHFNAKTYAGSILNSSLIEDNIGYDDDGTGIPFEYKTQWMSFGNPVLEKNFQGFEIAGELNSLTDLDIDVLIDDNTINSLNLLGSTYTSVNNDGAIGDVEIGGYPIGGDTSIESLAHFEKVADHGQIMLDGKAIQLYIHGSKIGMQFYLDYLSMFVVARDNMYQLQDKF